MKTKAELAAELAELAGKHGIELPAGFEQLKYPALAELFEQTQAKVAVAAATPPAAPAAETPPVTDATVAPSATSDSPNEAPTPTTDEAAPPQADGDAPKPPVPPPAELDGAPLPADGKTRASEIAVATPPARALPPGYKRPSIEEFVKAGYDAANYDAHFEEYEGVVANRKRYVVAPGHSLTGERGVLGPGKRVSEKDFGGESKLEDFVRAGYVVEEV